MSPRYATCHPSTCTRATPNASPGDAARIFSTSSVSTSAGGPTDLAAAGQSRSNDGLVSTSSELTRPGRSSKLRVTFSRLTHERGLVSLENEADQILSQMSARLPHDVAPRLDRNAGVEVVGAQHF